MIKLRSINKLSKHQKFSLNIFKDLYCKNEFPSFADKKFWDTKKNYFTEKNQILFVSGGSRNGNHLVTSLLDSIDELPYYPGEDKFLLKIFSLSKKNHKYFKNLLNKKNSYLSYLKMTGFNFDKWKKIKNFYEKNSKKLLNFNKKYWAGHHPKGVVAISEHAHHQHKVFYDLFKKKLINNFKKKNITNFPQLFVNYLDAYRYLCPIKKSTKYKYLYACSGMRREMSYFANTKIKFKCIVPIRDFRSYYFSKIKGRYNSTKINNFYLNEAWEQWKHKTIDYLLLKKKYPDKFVLVKYEDLINKKKPLIKC